MSNLVRVFPSFSKPGPSRRSEEADFIRWPRGQTIGRLARRVGDNSQTKPTCAIINCRGP